MFYPFKCSLTSLSLKTENFHLTIPTFLSDHWSLNINCGGDQVTTEDNHIYESDNDGSDGVSTFHVGKNWAVSSTGAFLDSGDNNNFIARTRGKLSMPDSELYSNARVSPLSISYYGLCLLNGNYSVKLHFAEIIIVDYNGFSSPGRRIFDVYIQVQSNIKATLILFCKDNCLFFIYSVFFTE